MGSSPRTHDKDDAYSGDHYCEFLKPCPKAYIDQPLDREILSLYFAISTSGEVFKIQQRIKVVSFSEFFGLILAAIISNANLRFNKFLWFLWFMEIDLPEGLQNFTIVQLHMKYRDSSGYLIITIQDVGLKLVFRPIFMVLRHR